MPAATPAAIAPPPAAIRSLGRSDFDATWRAMQAFTAARDERAPDEIWLTEHPPIYTLGLAGRDEHLHRANGVPVVRCDRGGQITYHGPGQLVMYVLVDLRRAKLGVRELVRMLEDCVIDWLGRFGVAARGRVDAPGVYVGVDGREAKIAALGLRVRNGCTYHGLAVNIDMDLSPFADIDPCGFPSLDVTHAHAFGIGRDVDRAGAEIAAILVQRLSARAPVRRSAAAAQPVAP